MSHMTWIFPLSGQIWQQPSATQCPSSKCANRWGSSLSTCWWFASDCHLLYSSPFFSLCLDRDCSLTKSWFLFLPDSYWGEEVLSILGTTDVLWILQPVMYVWTFSPPLYWWCGTLLLRSFIRFIPMLFCGWTSHVLICYEFSRWDEEVLRGVLKGECQTFKLWSFGSFRAPSALNLRLAVSHYNTSTLLNMEKDNCFLYFQKLEHWGICSCCFIALSSWQNLCLNHSGSR